MATIEGAGVELEVRVTGEGASLLVLHDMASNAAAVAPMCRDLAAGGVRVISYDRRGYGASGAPDVYTATTIQEQGEDAAAVLRALADGPALLVGLGFGALIALDLLVRHPALTRGAVLADPPVFAFVPEANEPLAAERLALEETLRADGAAGALEAWGGTDPADARAFLADYAGRASWSPSRRELRAISVPVRVVVTEGAPAHVAMAADALLGQLPVAERAGDVADAARALA
ncbi:MAG: alpha/beta fold hydrolase [Solirubrobacteraceae bacterium]|nr:alpha/beta fold hydrolase [Solirubrobacteraceae bacterium]